MRLCPCRPLHTYLLLAAPSPYSSSFSPPVSPSSTSSASPSRAMCAFYHAWQGNYRSQSGPRLHSTSSLPPLLLSISVESPLSSVRAGQARPMRQSTSQSVNHCTLIEGINYPASCTQSSCQRGSSLGLGLISIWYFDYNHRKTVGTYRKICDKCVPQVQWVLAGTVGHILRDIICNYKDLLSALERGEVRQLSVESLHNSTLCLTHSLAPSLSLPPSLSLLL